MTNEQIYQTQNILLESLSEFIKRASKAGATAAEVEALPAVADLLARICCLCP